MTPALRAYLDRLPFARCPSCGSMPQVDPCADACPLRTTPGLPHLHLACCGVDRPICDSMEGWLPVEEKTP